MQKNEATEAVERPRAPSALDRLTPGEWAERKGFAAPPLNPGRPSAGHPDRWKHEAAAALYGWTHHAYHHQTSPFQLTEQDYDVALETAAQYPACKPHKAAIAPSCPHKFTPEELS